ncbi:Mur ligase family protein [Ornithinibacillus halotolerans]|uniref:UDP-N-acetylmuramoyl-L-alanyl-D-glutamate--2, 6-diaminopimelate ligase n=1 Tax=Ornithinibacillus halotolerans TaxID=1274357 RepID=A0A916WB48_9BACI|nr:UDP-N-acetylmuramyl-tripeptide synthetase [Ornithinibacillus halotolerans]GGA83094.1 UDP-N-acetylmuramoyl-L-alanyl-D-glutamate--2,6-diaminopimelate ligase [Ornithinibacillus halotolerans]
MQLKQLLEVLDVTNSTEVLDVEINSVSYHSQKVEKGDLFVCVKGYKTDGHKYLPDAIQRGAVAAVVEDYQADLHIPQYVVSDSRIALAKLGSQLYKNPSSKMTMIGITATNGKTTTSYMTNAILEKEGRRTGLIGTVVVKNGDTSIPAELTTPESLDLQKYLNDMVENDVTHVTMEVSSAALELHRVEGVEYDIVSLNNMSKEHMEMHGTFERYFEVKSSLIRNASPDAYAVLNLDDKYSASLVDQTEAKVISFGLTNNNGYLHCKDLDLSTGRGKFTVEILKPFEASGIKYEPSEFKVELAVPGLHSVYNAMVAITIALLSGVRVTTIQETLKEFSGVPRRFEFIHEDEIKVVDDHFANPGNINVTLQTLDFMDYENLHLVYAIRGQRGATINRENAEVIVKWAEKLKIKEVIATRSVSHTTSKDEVTDEEVSAFQEVMDKAGIRVDLYNELPDAIHEALTHTTKGDLVLLAGCQGMDYGAGIALEALDKENVEVK